MNQDSNVPVPKVAAVGKAGVAIGALVTLLSLSGIIVPDNLTSGAEAAVQAVFIILSFAQALIQFAAGYFKQSNVKEV